MGTGLRGSLTSDTSRQATHRTGRHDLTAKVMIDDHIVELEAIRRSDGSAVVDVILRRVADRGSRVATITIHPESGDATFLPG